MKKYIKILSVLVLAFSCLSVSVSASAQDLMPAQNASLSRLAGDATHPDITLTPDKSELVHLDGEASSVIVGNPIHLQVVMDNTRTLLLIGGEPGATDLTVLDTEGEIIMQRHVLIASPKEQYVRIRRSCNEADKGCEMTSVYYCPGICHEIRINDLEEKSKKAELQLLEAKVGTEQAKALE